MKFIHALLPAAALVAGVLGLGFGCDDAPADQCTSMCRQLANAQCVPITGGCVDDCRMARQSLGPLCAGGVVDALLACASEAKFICDDRGWPYPNGCLPEWLAFHKCLGIVLDGGTTYDAGYKPDAGYPAEPACEGKHPLDVCTRPNSDLGLCYMDGGVLRCVAECASVGGACVDGSCYFTGAFDDVSKMLCLTPGDVPVPLDEACETPADCVAGTQCYAQKGYNPICYQVCAGDAECVHGTCNDTWNKFSLCNNAGW